MKLFTSSILLTLCIQYGNALFPSPPTSPGYACSANDTEVLYQYFLFEEPGPETPPPNVTESCDSCLSAPFVSEEVMPVDNYAGSCFAPSVYEENESCPANVTGLVIYYRFVDVLDNDTFLALPMDCQTCLNPVLYISLGYFGFLDEDPSLFNQTRISSTAPCTALPEPASCTIADVEAVVVCDEESDEFTFGTCLFGSASSITAECQTCLVSVFWYSNLRPEGDGGEALFLSSCVEGEAWPSDIGPPSSAPTMAPSMVPAPSPKSPTTKAPSSPTSAGANLIAGGGIVTTVAAFFALAT